jgi:hypothetical protein
MRAPRIERHLRAADIEAPKVSDDWQADAYAYAQAVGEVNYALGLKAHTLSRCGLRPEVRKAGTADEWEETTDARVLRVHAALKPPLGGQGALLAMALHHLEIAGEGYLHGVALKDAAGNDAGLVWEFLSVLEVEIKDGGGPGRPAKVTRNPWGGGSKGKEPVEENAYLARIHRASADYSQRAKSPMQGVLTILKQVVLLTQVIDAIAQSRLTANMLYVPWEVSLGPADEFGNPGAEDDVEGESFDEFESELREHLTAPITDRSAEASLIPLLMRGPALVDKHPTKDLIGIIDLARQLDDKFQGLRIEALDRLAAGLDLPPEMIQGKGNLSGLGGGNVAAAVDSEFIEKHVIPVGELVAEFLTVAYLRPMLQQFEGLTGPETDWFRYTLDSSEIIADRDRSDAATAGRQMAIISDDAWIAANGFEATDAIDPEEAYRRKLIELSAAAPTILAPYLLPLAFPDRPEIAEAMKLAAQAFNTPVPKPAITPGGGNPAGAPGPPPVAGPGQPGGPGGPQGTGPPRAAIEQALTLVAGTNGTGHG